MATPPRRGPAPTPPDKGSFPLDHFGECRPFQADYLACVKESGAKAADCKPIMKQYLECRMKNGLMAQEDLSHMGFADQQPAATTPADTPIAPAKK